MLPNFLVVGAQKAGTTTLHNYLVQHPQVFLPEQKETKFFVADDRYAKGLGYYEREYFSRRTTEIAVGEVDPDYLYFESALTRLRNDIDIGNTRFVVVLRNPVDRAFSHYLMTYRRGLEPLAFDEAVARESERLTAGYEAKMHYSYIGRGYYFRQIERFLQYIDRSQMHFIFSEDLRQNPSATLRDLFVFLGVDPTFRPANLGRLYHTATVPRSARFLKRIVGPSPEKRLVRLLIPSTRLRHRLRRYLLDWNQTTHGLPTLDYRARHRMSAFFEEENEQLGKFLGRDLSHWGTRSLSAGSDVDHGQG